MNRLGKHVTMVVIAFVLLASLHFSSAAAEGEGWIARAPMLTARGGLGVATVNGKIYAIGGMNNDSYLNVNEEYDPAADKWTAKASMPTARSGFAIVTFQNRIYVIGGTTGESSSDSSGFTGVTEVYTPATDTWTTKTSMPTPRADLSASVVDDKIYLIGGKKYVNHDPYYEESDINEVYDPRTDSWTNKTSSPIATFGYASAAVDNRIYVIGGGVQFWERWDFTFVEANQIYDPRSDNWTIGETFDPSLSYMAAAATTGIDSLKRIYTIGGFSSDGYSNSTYVYNPDANVWSTGSTMPTPRIYLDAVVLNDVLYAIGGFADENWLSTNEQFTPPEYGTVPPDLRILDPEDKLYKDVSLVFTINKPVEWIGYSLDDSANVTVEGNVTLKGIAQGLHRIRVYANDSRGNVGNSGLSRFSVDVIPPNISVLIPENKTYDSTDIQSVFIVDEQVKWMSYSIDGKEEVLITGNATLPVLSEGSHSVTFYAEDSVGNKGSSGAVYFSVQLFPTTLVIASAATIVIASAGGYLLVKHRMSRKKG